MIPSLSRLRLLCLAISATCLLLALLGPTFARADFGIQSSGIAISDASGSPDRQAGSHPFEMTTSLAFNTTTNSVGNAITDQDVKDVQVQLPPGLIGNSSATPQCTAAQFHTPPGPTSVNQDSGASCPADTQVGLARFAVVVGTSAPIVFHFGVYNLVPPPGFPAAFGFNPVGLAVTLLPTLRTGGDYGVSVRVDNASQAQPFFSSTVTLWGVPGDHSHDKYRGECLGPEGESLCEEPSDAGAKPFLTMPTSCSGGPLEMPILADSWQQPGSFVEAQPRPFNADAEGHPALLTGCGALQFAPTFSAQPDTTAADTPTGLHAHLHIPQNEEPEALATSQLKDATVTLPAGLSVNPSSADGLASCSSAQIGLTSAPGATPVRFTPAPATCPDASKLGTVEVDTPLLDHPLHGSVYLAAQNDNPFGSLLAIYVAVDDPQTGVVLKLAGHVQADPSTGQLTTTFSENPQLPFEDLKFDFFGGNRAPLTTPTACGTYTTTTDLEPWSTPETPDTNPSDSFKVTSGPNGSACPESAAQRPLTPTFNAGTTNPVAGAFSPFVLKLSREDGQQEFSSLNVSTPPGIAADLRGVPYCSDAALAAAANRSGAAEQASPSCPAASQIGKVTVGAGAGPDPYYVQGKVYLSGPYKSAPLSLAIVTPALAGPFDLGTVLVRSALQVNPETAQITVRSDPLPRILDGIPLDLRDIRVAIDRPHFTNNPTDCEPMSLFADVFGSSGAAARLSNRFQVLDCGALGFAPKLSLDLRGSTKRAGHPALSATLKARAGDANIASAQVTLPHSEFLDNAHIQTVCTRVQFNEGAGNGAGCPAASVYGHASAVTPLLDQPLSGPVYLRSSTHKLPDLVAALNGQISVVLDGRIDTGKGGGIRNTFTAVPDAPVSKFVLSMQGGNKGLLVNSEDICGKPQRAIADFTAQNGKMDNFNPVIANSCKAKGHGNKKHRGRK